MINFADATNDVTNWAKPQKWNFQNINAQDRKQELKLQSEAAVL